MPFTTNDDRINLKGRPKGSTNNNEIKERVELIIHEVFSIESIKSDLKQLKARDRLNIFLGLLKYVLPTIKTVDMSVNSDMSWAELFTLDFPDE